MGAMVRIEDPSDWQPKSCRNGPGVHHSSLVVHNQFCFTNPLQIEHPPQVIRQPRDIEVSETEPNSFGGLESLKDYVKEIALRVIIGGVVVSVFSFLADLLKPKSFAGLFGAAPSVALATLALTEMKEGRAYASIEARSMVLGAVAFVLYACVVSRVLMRVQWRVLSTTSIALVLWFGCAFGLWFAVLK